MQRYVLSLILLISFNALAAPTQPQVIQAGTASALNLNWTANNTGWIAIDRSHPGCSGTCYESVHWSNSSIGNWTDTTVQYGVPYRYKVYDSSGHDGYSQPVTAIAGSGGNNPTFSTLIFQDEFNETSFWKPGSSKVSNNNHWTLFDNYGQNFWHEAQTIKGRARTVRIARGNRALAIESEPLRKQGSSVPWCRWAIGKDQSSSQFRNARSRCRVHTSYISTFKGWENGVQQGAKFGPGIKVEARVNFEGAKRPGQLFDMWLQVEKPRDLYDSTELARFNQGAWGVAYDGLAYNGTEIDIFEFGYGHRSWNTAWGSNALHDVSRFNTAVHHDRRTATPYANQKIGNIIDTLNQEPIFIPLRHINTVDDASAHFDIRSGWHTFTMEWVINDDATTKLNLYVQPEGSPRYKYLSIDNFHQLDTSNDHFLVISNEVDQNFTGHQDGLWKYIEQGPNTDGHNSSTGTAILGGKTYYRYPKDRMLVDYVRVYQQD